jgi:hypothetical protein
MRATWFIISSLIWSSYWCFAMTTKLITMVHVMKLSPASCLLNFLRSTYCPQHHTLNTCYPRDRPSFRTHTKQRVKPSSVYFNLYVFWQQAGTQNVLKNNEAPTPRIQSITCSYFFGNEIFDELAPFPNVNLATFLGYCNTPNKAPTLHTGMPLNSPVINKAKTC